ncbi:asparagine synthase-related protein, partial [Rhizorhabdus sp. FW153]|uniref:asparagine synthase-related protein n=1 Tax=Rhizorhabdus sp. FW153 TaxID=3400216 RepID=UPI003CE7A02A
LRGRLTGLEGISEILGGTEINPFDETLPSVTWSPWPFTCPELEYQSSTEAISAIRATIIDVVAKSVAAASAPVLLELSGGVDSSILAAALHTAARPFEAVNLMTPDKEGDERVYARLVAARLGVDLAEYAVPADVDLLAPPRRRLALPGIPAMLRPADRILAALAEVRASPAFMSGSGGDCVFATPYSATPAADLFRRHGPGRRFARSLVDLATLYRASIWATGRRAWRFIRDPDWRLAPVRNTSFLAAEHWPASPQWHPWMTAPRSAPPGKQAHVRAIAAALAHIDGFERQQVAPMLFPLLARPVIEACLKAPSWMWIEGGVTRAIARRAFADRLPHEVIWRQSKGGMDAYCYRNFDACRPRLRAFLLEGHLARAGLLATHEIDAFLAAPPREHDVRFYRLLPIIDAEGWARSWLGDG